MKTIVPIDRTEVIEYLERVKEKSGEIAAVYNEDPTSLNETIASIIDAIIIRINEKSPILDCRPRDEQLTYWIPSTRGSHICFKCNEITFNATPYCAFCGGRVVEKEDFNKTIN